MYGKIVKAIYTDGHLRADILELKNDGYDIPDQLK